MRVSRYLIPATAVVSIAAAVFITQLSGQWVASGGEDMGRRIAAGVDISPDDIKGWMTFEEVAEAYSIPIDELMEGVGLEDTPTSTQMRTLESDEFSPQTVREWVSEFTGQPLTTSGGDHSGCGH